MKLKINEIQNKGDASKEYVRLDVLEDCELGNHALADTTFTGAGKVSNKLRHFYWFPDKEVKKGEHVVLRTCVGEDDNYKAKNGKTVHRFYWGLKAAVWNDDKDTAVLFEIADWEMKKASG